MDRRRSAGPTLPWSSRLLLVGGFFWLPAGLCLWWALDTRIASGWRIAIAVVTAWLVLRGLWVLLSPLPRRATRDDVR